MILSSADGLEWTPSWSEAYSWVVDVAWCGERFVAVDYSSAGSQVLTSTDGWSWSRHHLVDDPGVELLDVQFGAGAFAVEGLADGLATVTVTLPAALGGGRTSATVEVMRYPPRRVRGRL